VEVKVVVQPRAIDATLPERGELDRVNKRLRVLTAVHKRNEQGGRAVLEQVVEIGRVAAARSDHAIDVGEVVERYQVLYFARLPSVVLGVEPQGVEMRGSGVNGHVHGRVILACDAHDLVVSKAGFYA
jgi:hypothetical protein